jgi:mRNA interferase MazF
MRIREKCDEKNWEDGSDYGTTEAERLQNLSTVTVAPVTSTIRGVPSEVVLNGEDGIESPCAVNLHSAVTVSQERLGRRVAQLRAARMNEVCAALRFCLGVVQTSPGNVLSLPEFSCVEGKKTVYTSSTLEVLW